MKENPSCLSQENWFGLQYVPFLGFVTFQVRPLYKKLLISSETFVPNGPKFDWCSLSWKSLELLKCLMRESKHQHDRIKHLLKPF